MANRAKWPQLGVQPQNLNEHATQLIAEATALLALEKGQRQKLPDQIFESFINSVLTYARKTREQPSSHEILDKLNQLHHLTKSTLTEDITLIKNAVSHTAIQPSARIPTWAEKVRSGGPPSHPPTPPTSLSTTASSKEREVIVKLDSPESAALLRQKTPEELRRTINEALQQQWPNSNQTTQIVAARQLKSGDIAIHTANTADAKLLKENPSAWLPSLGSRARVLKPTYGVLVHGVRTDKENIDPNKQAEAIEKIQTENATLHPGVKVTYAGWLTKNGAKKTASSLVVEFTTKEQANRVIREGLVLGACQHDCELYDRGCKLKQCYKCQRYGHIGTQCTASETCGQCAEPHNTRQCRKREEDPSFTPKCALCKGQHAAWSNICQIRQAQLAKVELARRSRPTYYYSSETPERLPHTSKPTNDAGIVSTGRANQGNPASSTNALQPRKRPAETADTYTQDARVERRTVRPRTAARTGSQRTQRLGAFHVFTPEDTDVFAYNKRELERAIEIRERELRQQGQESIWMARTRQRTTPQVEEQQNKDEEEQPQEIPIDPLLLEHDQQTRDSQLMVIDE